VHRAATLAGDSLTVHLQHSSADRAAAQHVMHGNAAKVLLMTHPTTAGTKHCLNADCLALIS
jgi:hypothetical protein